MNAPDLAAEAALLSEHLGSVPTGGLIEQLTAVGPASVPELGIETPLELALALWPFPLEGAARGKLESLGYRDVSETQDSGKQRFFHPDRHILLHCVAAGSDLFTDQLVIRDFLRHSSEARTRFLEHHPLQEGSPEDLAFLNDAQRWWIAFYGFTPLEMVTQALEGFMHPWFFSSGWAIDIFLGSVTRVHHDVDVVVPRSAIWPLKHHLEAKGWQLVLPLEGKLEPWPPESRQEPDIQIHAHRAGKIIDILLTEMDNETWHYRRDPRITAPSAQALLQTAEGLPYLAPEMILLFKSKNTSFPNTPRPQDEGDFRNVLPSLAAAQRHWLREALGKTDPEHRWLEVLAR